MQTQQAAPGVTPLLVCLLLGEFCVRRAVPRVNFSQYLSSGLALLSAEKPQPERAPIRVHWGRKMDYLCRTCPHGCSLKRNGFTIQHCLRVSAEKSQQGMSEFRRQHARFSPSFPSQFPPLPSTILGNFD